MAKKKNVLLSNKAVIYARVSSKDQDVEGYSIPAQLKTLREYAVRKQYSIVKEFTDIETAKKAGRTAFNSMLNFVEEHEDISHILVEKNDRLLRNFADHVLIENLTEARGVSIHFVKEGTTYDRNAHSSEKLVLGFHTLISKGFIDKLKEEVCKGMLEKAEQGVYPSGASYGYINARENGKSIIKINPLTAPFVRKMFELYATGSYSLLTLRKKMLTDGMIYRNGRNFYTSNVETILKNEFYIGVFHWKGKRYENAQHEPLVSRELFLQVQNQLRNPHKNKSKKGLFPFSNLLSCGVCGCALTAELQKNKYIYYRCTGYKGNCKQAYLKQEVLELHFESVLKSIQINDEMQEAILHGLREKTKTTIDYHNACIQQVSNQIGTLDKKIEAIYDDKVSGDVSAELWKRKSNMWQEEKDALVTKLIGLQNSDTHHIETATTILELAKKAADLFMSRPADQKRRMITILVSNCSYRDGKIDAVLKPVFQELLVSSKTGNWCARQDSNLRPAD